MAVMHDESAEVSLVETYPSDTDFTTVIALDCNKAKNAAIRIKLQRNTHQSLHLYLYEFQAFSSVTAAF